MRVSANVPIRNGTIGERENRGAGQHRPNVVAQELVGRRVVGEEACDRVPVGDLEVVRLEAPVDDQLPVRGPKPRM